MSTAITTAATSSRSTSSSTTTINYHASSDNTHYNQSSNRKCRRIADSIFWSFGYIKWCRFHRFGFHFEWDSDSGNYYFVRLDAGFRYDYITEWSKYSYSNIYSTDGSDISNL